MAKYMILQGLDKQLGQGGYRNTSLSSSAAFCQIKMVVDFVFGLESQIRWYQIFKFVFFDGRWMQGLQVSFAILLC